MFRKQNHDMLVACERDQTLKGRRHFLTGWHFIHHSGILHLINVCDRLDLRSWQLFLVGGHPWRGGSEPFPPPGRDRTLLCLPRILQLSRSCWNWHYLLWQARGGGSHGFWHCPQGELSVTAGITEKALKSWQKQPLAFFAGWWRC